MKDINNITLIGRLVKEPELKEIQDYKIVKFTLAVNEQKENEVSFIDCQAWGKLAEIINQYAAKGKQVCIQGRIKQDRWQDDQGKTKSKVFVNVDNMQLLGAKSE